MKKIVYNGEKIPYEIIRSKIKNMYINIKYGEVIVKAPIKLQEKYIIEFVNKKSKWIYEKVKETQKKKQDKMEIEEKDIQKLEEVVKKSIQEYSKLLSVTPNKVRIRDIKYAWGSCSSKRNITINKQLALKGESEIKYVVLHEMCHLKHMNHSEQFWNLVESYMPNYKIYIKKLRS